MPKRSTLVALCLALGATRPRPVRGEVAAPATALEVRPEVGDPARPVEPLQAEPPAESASPKTTGAATSGPPPSPRWPAPTLLDPVPGTPAGPPLPPPASFARPAPLLQGLALSLSLARRAGMAPDDVPPRYGGGVNAAFFRRVVPLGSSLALRGRLDLSHHRFSGTDTALREGPAGPVEVSGLRLVSQTSFVVGPELAWELGRWRLSVAAGFGLSVGYFHTISARYAPSDLTAYQGIVRAGAALLYAWNAAWSFGVRAAWWGEVWPKPERLDADEFGRRREVFGDWADAGPVLVYGF